MLFRHRLQRVQVRRRMRLAGPHVAVEPLQPKAPEQASAPSDSRIRQPEGTSRKRAGQASKGQRSQAGRRAAQVRRPCLMSSMWKR